MEIHQHGLLKLCLAIVDCNGVVVPVEAMDERLYAGLLEVAQHAGCLPRLLPQNLTSINYFQRQSIPMHGGFRLAVLNAHHHE